MLGKPVALVLWLHACVASVAFAQQGLPRIAVIPLNPVSVSKSDATAFTGLIETALVKTGAFTVLEQNQVTVILEAQERSIADCTDEKCAIDFGKLLAAEQIVLGSISAVGGKVIINAKIIDVTTGRTLRADTVEAASLASLTGEVELLAFKLAGLTFKAGGQEQVARAFGELFVETEPEGADVLLNGLPKGRSPIVLERVPIGRVSLEARKDALYGIRDVDVTADGLIKVKLELKVSLGNLFVKSSQKEGMRVTLDGSDLGALSTGLYEDLPAGEHRIVLSGNGYAWEGSAVVQTGKTVTVEAFPREVGSVSYTIPADAQAEISARDYRMVVRGAGALENVPAGTYAVRLTGTDYEPVEMSLVVRRAATASLVPGLKRTEAFERTATYEALSRAVNQVVVDAASDRRFVQGDVERARAVERDVAGARFSFPDLLDKVKAASARISQSFDEQERADAETAFRGEAERLSAILAWNALSVSESDVLAARRLQEELAASRFRFADLDARLRELVPALETRLKTDALVQRRDALVARLARAGRTRRGLRTVGFLSLGVGAAGAATAVISYLLGQQAHTDYDSATLTPDAEAAWGKVAHFTGLLNAGIASGSGGAGLGIVLVLAAPGTTPIERELAEVKAELARLGGGAR